MKKSKRLFLRRAVALMMSVALIAPLYPVKAAAFGGRIDLFEKNDHNAYVEGYSDGSFHPNGNITRAETAVMLYRVMKEDAKINNSTSGNNFSDVSKGAWYNTEVSVMSGLGIIDGYSNGTFGGNQNITRAEFATIIARIDGGAISDWRTFADTIGHWAEEYIQSVLVMFYMNGYLDGTFQPDAPITRAEAVTTINRMLRRDNIGETLENIGTFWDVTPDKWYYVPVTEASTNHNYYLSETDGAELWTKFW